MEPEPSAIIGGPSTFRRFALEEGAWVLGALAITVLLTQLLASLGGRGLDAAPAAALFGFHGLIGLHVVRADRAKLPEWLRVDRRALVRGLAGGALLLAINALYGIALDALGVVPPDVAAELRGLLPEWALVAWAGVLAPLVEELYFRGRLLDELGARLGPGWAGAITSVGFAAVHGIREFFPAYLIFAVVLLALRRRTGGLAAPVVAHVLNNVFALYAG